MNRHPREEPFSRYIYDKNGNFLTKQPEYETVWAHGFVTYGGRKLSKSSGVTFELEEAIQRHGPEALRYYLLREVPWNGDGDITRERFDERYTTELANDIGNLASRVLAMLSKDTINLGAMVARVDPEKCATCLACVRACPYGVPFINEDRYSEIDPAKCHGCGICASECPAKAIELTRFEDAPIKARLEGLLERSA